MQGSLCVGEKMTNKGEGGILRRELKADTDYFLLFCHLKTLTAGSDQSITLPSVPVVQQLCQVVLSSDATNNAVLHWADCVSPFVHLCSHSLVLGGTILTQWSTWIHWCKIWLYLKIPDVFFFFN